MFVINFVTQGHLAYALPFLELFPEYICPPDIRECSHIDRCREPRKIGINWEAAKSLNNWVERLGLECAKGYEIGLMGSMFFAGMTVTGLFVTRLGDIYGRKWPTWISSVLSVPLHAGIMLSTNLYLTIILFFF
jgi:hypothetical protein